MTAWSWEVVDAGRSGSAGDLSKMFRNEGVKEPGVFAIDPPQADATVLAREGIQNSWDAARDLDATLRSRGEDAPDFRMRFEFRSLDAEAKDGLVTALGLRELAERAAANDRKALGLGVEDCLVTLDSPDPLEVLVVEEHAASGMYGPWKGAASRLYLALVSLGFTAKAEGSGGSYGYGKAGLIRGSAIRSVVGYTCFEERGDDPGVTRRLLGMTYWAPHAFGGEDFTGFARLGATGSDDSTVPFENDQADNVAASLGLDGRSASAITELGTTFLLIDPTIRPEDLCRAIERNWWPALEERMFEVEVVAADGEVHIPRPRRDPALKSFIRGFELATTAQDSDHDEEARRSLTTYKNLHLGHLGLVAEMGGWSYATNAESDDEGNADHQSLVALVRGPHMVVEYLTLGRQQPFIRGTFLAHDDVDELLRQTEPKAHDSWLSRVAEEGIDPLAPKVAAEVQKRIRKEVREFRKELKPPPRREQDIRLPLLEDLLKSILENHGSAGKPPPQGDPRTVAIRLSQKVEAADDSQIRLKATATFTLHKTVEVDEAVCLLHFRYAFDEDGRLGDECDIDVDLPQGFERIEAGARKGVLVRGPLGREPLSFDIVSDPYDADWTGQLVVSGDVDPTVEDAAEATPVAVGGPTDEQ